MRAEALLLILLVLAAYPAAGIVEEKEEPVHIEPIKGSGYIDAVSLYSIYLNIFVDIINGNYSLALEKISAFHTEIFPTRLREKLDALNRDLWVLTDSISKATVYVNMSQREIMRGNYTGARRLIDDASFYTTKSSIYLGVILDDWIKLARIVLVYTNPDYYDKVRSYELEVKLIIERIRENIYALQAKTIGLLTTVYEHTVPGDLLISLRVYKKTIMASEPVRLIGRLYFRNGSSLENATIFIYLIVPNTSLIYRYEIRSGHDGWFDVSFYIPRFFYQGATLNKLYNETFHAVAVSSIVEYGVKHVALARAEYNVLYRVNRVIIRGPNVQNPDLDAVYTIYYVPRNASRRLVVLYDDRVVLEEVLNESPAKIRIHTPWNATPGYHKLVFKLSAYREYTPVSQSMNVIVAYKPYEPHVSVSSFIVYPFQRIVVEGRITDLDGRPLRNETIIVMGRRAATTDSDGVFRVEIDAPFTALIGIEDIRITVATREHYYADIALTENVAVVNAVTLFFIALYIYLVLRYASRR